MPLFQFLRSERISVLLLATAACEIAVARPAVVPKPARAPEFRLSGKRVTFPMVTVGGYPFVEASVAGVRGKLMLDTGSDQALSLNDHRVPLAGGVPIGTGSFGSGQRFPIRLHPAADDVRVGAVRYGRVTQVQSQDARMLESLTPDFLGWVGYYWWSGYALKLDYARSRATFYKRGAADYLAGEKRVAVIPFETRKRPNDPLVNVRLGEVDLTATIDSGQGGTLYVDEATKARLLAAGVLIPGRNGAFDIGRLDIAGTSLPGIKDVEVSTSPFIPATAIGTPPRNVLTLGFHFLRQYTSVWDFRTKRLYLLTPTRQSRGKPALTPYPGGPGGKRRARLSDRLCQRSASMPRFDQTKIAAPISTSGRTNPDSLIE